jgi:hypothetical protein
MVAEGQDLWRLSALRCSFARRMARSTPKKTKASNPAS